MDADYKRYTLTAEQAAEYSNVHYRDILDAAKNRQVSYFQKNGKDRLFSRFDLDKFISSKVVHAKRKIA